MSQKRRNINLSFGESDIKSRIKSVLGAKKPKVIVTIIAVIAVIIAAVCLLTNAVKKDKEVDFVATNTDEKIYSQVTQTISSEQTRERELRPLMQIGDNYEKFILTMDKGITNSIEGIKIKNIVEWLLQ